MGHKILSKIIKKDEFKNTNIKSATKKTFLDKKFFIYKYINIYNCI